MGERTSLVLLPLRNFRPTPQDALTPDGRMRNWSARLMRDTLSPEVRNN